MDKTIVFLVIATILLIGLGVAIVYQEQNKPTMDNTTYLPFYNETPTKIALLNSSMSYAKSDKTEKDIFGDTIVNEGDQYILINGTIRNDYDKDYFIWLYGSIYNESGERIGYTRHNKFWGKYNAPYIHLNKSSTTSFEMRIIYNKTDVSSYVIYLPTTPKEEWLP